MCIRDRLETPRVGSPLRSESYVASVGVSGCSQRIIFLVWGYGKRDAARHCSTEQTNKAQNDRRVVPDVGLGVAAGNTPGTTLSSIGYKVIIC